MYRSLGLTTVLSLVLAGCASESLPEADVEELGSTSDALSVRTIKVRNKDDAKLWEGTVASSDAPIPNAPPECASVPCDHIRLKIDLPHGTFNNPNKPGGVQVALRWFGNPGPHTLPPDVPGCCGEFDTLNLYVYKDDTLVASSPGIIAVSQSTLIPEPQNGFYDVWIAWDPTYNVSAEMEYEALAEVEFSPRINPVRRLLPDLEFRGTERITFDTPSFPIFEPDPPPGSSCFISEMVEDGAQNCLRFDQIIANIGKAPVEIGFTIPSGEVVEDDEEFPVHQRMYNSDGTYSDQPGGSAEFHATHGHYHYSSFANAALWRSNSNGTRLGSAPLREAQKVSFCMADIRIDSWGEKGDGPRRYFAPDCLFPAYSDAEGDHFAQGMNNGWSDVYDWYIPDQYIEVTGIQNGYYLLSFCADPFNELEEADEDNNCITNHIRLRNMGTANKSVEVIGVIDDDDHGHGNGHGHGHGHGHGGHNQCGDD